MRQQPQRLAQGGHGGSRVDARAQRLALGLHGVLLGAQPRGPVGLAQGKGLGHEAARGTRQLGMAGHGLVLRRGSTRARLGGLDVGRQALAFALGVLPLAIATMALSTIMKEGAKDGFSAEAQSFPSLVPTDMVNLLGASISLQHLAIIVVAFAAIGLLQWFVGGTRLAAYAAWTASVRSPFAAALLYILPLAAMVLAVAFIFYGERMRPIMARLTAPLTMPLVSLMARFRRA